MRVLVDGLLLYLNFGQIGNYSRSIYDNLIKYTNLDIEIIKDYEIKSNLYKNKSTEILIDRYNDNYNSVLEYIIKNNFNFFHCLNNGFSIPKNYDGNTIITVSNLLPFFYEEFCLNDYLHTFFNKLPFGVLRSDNIIFPSVSAKKDFLKEFSLDSKNTFINYGIISDFFTKNDDFMVSIYLKSKFNIDYKYIIFYGDFNKRKSLDQALFLFRDLRKIYKELYFLICSDSFNNIEYLNTLKKLGKDLGLNKYIKYLCKISVIDKVNLFNKALLFIDLSLYENVNLNIVEAYYCETPIICSDIDLYKEYFGECCFYYDSSVDYICVSDYVNNYAQSVAKSYVYNKFNKNMNLKIMKNIY